MKVKDYKKFAKFNYTSNLDCENIFSLGEIVINKDNEIGVILQIHDDFDLRTDMFGNECITNLQVATIEQIKKFRFDLIKYIDASEIKKDIENSKELVKETILFLQNCKNSEHIKNNCELIIEQINFQNTQNKILELL